MTTLIDSTFQSLSQPINWRGVRKAAELFMMDAGDEGIDEPTRRAIAKQFLVLDRTLQLLRMIPQNKEFEQGVLFGQFSAPGVAGAMAGDDKVRQILEEAHAPV